MRKHRTWSGMRDEARKDPVQAAQIDAFKREIDEAIRLESVTGPIAPKDRPIAITDRLMTQFKRVTVSIDSTVQAVSHAVVRHSSRSGALRRTKTSGRMFPTSHQRTSAKKRNP